VSVCCVWVWGEGMMIAAAEVGDDACSRLPYTLTRRQ
jgi:hypothetical protein